MTENEPHPEADDKNEGDEVLRPTDHPEGLIEDDPRVPPTRKVEFADSPRLATPSSA